MDERQAVRQHESGQSVSSSTNTKQQMMFKPILTTSWYPFYAIIGPLVCRETRNIDSFQRPTETVEMKMSRRSSGKDGLQISQIEVNTRKTGQEKG